MMPYLQKKVQEKMVLSGALVALAMAILWQTAITADAYITFRVVDNFVHGYGLRWNTDERVQVYTHPLWMLLHIPFYALWNNIFYITVAISIACALGAVVITIRTFRKPLWPTLALLIVPLATSMCVVDNSIMGLENPLLHCLFAFFGWVVLRAEEKYFWFWLSFAVALSLLTRLDTVFMFIPAMGYLLATRRGTLSVRQVMAGSLPVIGWEIFSLFYYGFLFPNTKYAKMPTMWFDREYINQGLHYLLSLAAFDIIATGFMAFAAIGVPLYYVWSRRGRQDIPPVMPFIALGIVWYDAYVISVGGTYIFGRFWSLQVFASIWLVYGLCGDYIGRRLGMALMVAMIATRLFYPYVAVKHACPSCLQGNITRKWYAVAFTHSGAPTLEGRPAPAHHEGGPRWVGVVNGIGMFGFDAGPSAHLVNPYAYTDPLLARLPNTGIPITESYIGHLEHPIPAGYVHALQTRTTEGMDPDLALYTKELYRIVAGDLWSVERIMTIIRFNLGRDDYLLDNYLRRQQKKD